MSALTVLLRVPAVLAMVAVNAALVASGQLALSVPLVVGVSAIAPLVMWRVHAMRSGEVAGSHVSAPGMASMETSTPSITARETPVQSAPVIRFPALPSTAPAAPAPKAPDADPLLSSARELDAASRISTGKPVALRVLQAELRIGQKRAQRIRLALT